MDWHRPPVILLAAMLAACGHSITADEAREAAQARMIADFPSVKGVLEKLDTRTDEMSDKWRVTFAARQGTGAVVIDVDKRTGKAVIVEVAQ
ncbi:MAG TPA: hypothetical protein VFH89_05745 [Sphingomicrobium sp.]|nr:hypothetical protein [Sphingomicrobium sp.]